MILVLIEEVVLEVATSLFWVGCALAVPVTVASEEEPLAFLQLSHTA